MFIKKAGVACLRRLTRLFKKKQRYSFGNYTIQLPSEHKLPFYQGIYPRYDRFLPYLVAELDSRQSVLDIGANCGDTLVALAAGNSKLNYICVEPEPLFYDLLLHNIEAMKTYRQDLQINAIQAFVSQNTFSKKLVGSYGTRTAIVDGAPNSIRSISADSIVENEVRSPLVLLKSDVDGFDFDAVLSARNAIKKFKPLIFFEAQVDTKEQKDGYDELFHFLATNGYEDFAVFDNFGNLISKNADANFVQEILDYIWNLKSHGQKTPIFYLDVLCISPVQKALVERACQKFSSRNSLPR